MGDCKDNMSRSEPKPVKKKDKKWFNKKKDIDPSENADKFVHHVDVAHDIIDHLVQVKADDVKNEGASERPKNELKLSLLKSIERDIISIQEKIDIYGDI